MKLKKQIGIIIAQYDIAMGFTGNDSKAENQRRAIKYQFIQNVKNTFEYVKKEKEQKKKISKLTKECKEVYDFILSESEINYQIRYQKYLSKRQEYIESKMKEILFDNRLKHKNHD